MTEPTWVPLPPGTHEYEGGSVIIDDDGFITRTYSLSLRDMVEGSSGVPPMPFRLCRRVDAPDVPMMPQEIRETIKDALSSWVSEIEEQKWRGLTSQQFVDQRITEHDAALAWLDQAPDVPQGEAMPYSHRNGETEPPTMNEKWFWFKGIGPDVEPSGVFFVADGNAIDTRSDSCITDTLHGQWWGPVTPPWEQRPAQDALQAEAMREADWSHAPEWAMYHTIDKDGSGHWWEKAPVLNDKYTWWLYDWSVPGPHYRHGRDKGRPDDIDWRTTLRQRPLPAEVAQ